MLNLADNRIRFNWDQCRQCGVCLAACPQQALSARMGKSGYQIACDPKRCTRCRLCVKICRDGFEDGRRVPEIRQLEQAAGRVIAAAMDREIRFHASSGGVTRTLIAEALQHQWCDAVYTLQYPPGGGEAEGHFLTSPEGMERIPNSLYRPVLWGANLGGGDPQWRRVWLVGLPCQVRTARRLIARRYPGWELFAITIFCKKQKTFGYSHWLLGGRGSIADLQYRGEGWPGSIRNRRSGENRPFTYPARAWNLPACAGCFDPLNTACSDLTVLDPWDIVSSAEEKEGVNLVLMWSEEAKRLLAASPVEVRCEVTAADCMRSFPQRILEQKPLRSGLRRCLDMLYGAGAALLLRYAPLDPLCLKRSLMRIIQR